MEHISVPVRRLAPLTLASSLAFVVLTACGGGSSGALPDGTTELENKTSTLNALPPEGETIDAPAPSAGWGSLAKLFSADSLWNSRPLNPVLGTTSIPDSTYVPAVAEGAYSTGIFVASADHSPMTISGASGQPGVWDPDAQEYRTVTIAHWPPNVIPATGTDGNADIIDPATGIIHSFWQLKQVNGVWTAAQYAWSSMTGRGWADPAHYFQGSRATGVPTVAGIIRKDEVDDGQKSYAHALAMSMTFNALAANPKYTFPATSGDSDAESTNTGMIPQGTLMMLPPDFDTSRITSAKLRKVAETLKTYGAYVVDRNHGTPFYIYVENGSGFDLHNGGWNNTVVDELKLIQYALRPMTGNSGYVDGNGASFTPERNLNLMSMRGPWKQSVGNTAGTFDTISQAVVFPSTSSVNVMINDSGSAFRALNWTQVSPGTAYRLTAKNSGGATFRLQLLDSTSGSVKYDSGEMKHGAMVDFAWPANSRPVLLASSGVGSGSSVSATLVAR